MRREKGRGGGKRRKCTCKVSEKEKGEQSLQKIEEIQRKVCVRGGRKRKRKREIQISIRYTG